LGDGEAFILGETPPPPRAPSGLYETGDTVFRVFFLADGAVEGHVEQLDLIRDSLFRSLSGRQARAVLMVDLEDLVLRVTHALGRAV
jgi:hypothetical protein